MNGRGVGPRMRVGIVSYWFNRGQAVVSRRVRAALDAAGVETFVLARPTKEGFVRSRFIDRTGPWAQRGVTAASRYEIPEVEYLAWAADNVLDVVLCDQNLQFAEIAALLVALKMNGETVEEVTGFAMGLREMAVSVRPRSSMLVDTCGTGGDGKGTFNISTTAALVTAGAGVPVAKHGNRAVSSSCGSADVLSALGVRVDAGSRAAEECIDVAGIGFLFAPAHHPAMKRVMGARRSLGIPTIFNILGPLANPAGARARGRCYKCNT